MMMNKKTIVWISFIIYICIVINLTIYERGLFQIPDWSSASFNDYLTNYTNFEPLLTIKLFIRGYYKGVVSFNVFFINIIGNLVLFIPLAYFVPRLFRQVNTFFKFLGVVIILGLSIEIIQFVTQSGSADIDDVILNVGGACLGYLLLKPRL